ncbi:MAG: hypothetical protein JSR59_09265 [Proteobacteria bacterium]|nr:hypothetical protein [Pseudomonadota bacterium]
MNNRTFHRIAGRRILFAAASALLGAAALGAMAAGLPGRVAAAAPSRPVVASKLPNCGPDGSRVCNSFGCWCQ